VLGHQAVRDGVRAGCDSNCGDPYRQFGDQAFTTGLLEEAELDASVRRLLRPMFQLGLFDPPALSPWNQVGHIITL
jgi:beta-glucosidase-like glycosyl hydrolase